jgi:ubiquinone/menaquinone biosynthesis C-methylase UbiE
MTSSLIHPAECLYESGSLSDGSGMSLRPGGSQLTARAVFCGNWHPGERVIDIGCGRGETLDYLRRCGLDAIGVDVSNTVLCQAKLENDDLFVIQASGDNLPFANNSVDGVIAECSLSLIQKASEALIEFHRVLRPGGRLVITDLYARAPQPAGDIDDSPPSCFSGILGKDRTIQQLERVGFDLDSWEDHSDVLKTFITRFIFEHGSLDALWSGSTTGEKAEDRMRSVTSLRPGYAILVARKGR